MRSHAVIPERREVGEPGIHSHRREYWIRARGHRPRPDDGLTGADTRIALYIRLARPVRAFGVRACAQCTMTERSSEGLDERRRKLLFRAWRRGVREMDLIVGRFADAHIDKFDDAGARRFRAADRSAERRALRLGHRRRSRAAPITTPPCCASCIAFHSRGSEAHRGER